MALCEKRSVQSTLEQIRETWGKDFVDAACADIAESGAIIQDFTEYFGEISRRVAAMQANAEKVVSLDSVRTNQAAAQQAQQTTRVAQLG